MKKLLIIFLFPLSVFAQDTIITTKGVVVPCTITVVAPDYITYTDSLGTFTIPNNMVFDKKINGHPFIAAPKTVEVYKEINLAGRELIGASNTFYGGMVLMIIGGGLATAGALVQPDAPDRTIGKVLMYSGIGISGIGFCVNIAAFSNIGNAGKHLSRIKPE